MKMQIILDPASWTKERMPVLETDQKKGLYGPGHNSFTTDEDGNDIMVYHARTYDGIKTKVRCMIQIVMLIC